MQLEHGYHIIAASRAKPSQSPSTNADAFAFSIDEQEPKAVMAVVCDGISASRHGSRVAKCTCTAMQESFQSSSRKQSTAESWFSAALVSAHHGVCAKYPTGDANCPVAAAIVLPQSKSVVIGHAGDSYGAIWETGKLTTLTNDHVQSVVHEQAGKRTLVDGAAAVTKAISKFVGQGEG